MSKIKWAVIGAGGIADRRTIPAIFKDDLSELVALYDRNAQVCMEQPQVSAVVYPESGEEPKEESKEESTRTESLETITESGTKEEVTESENITEDLMMIEHQTTGESEEIKEEEE